MGRQRLAIREIASLRREKTIVLAIIVQLFVAGFSSILFVGLVGLYDPGATTGGPNVQIGVAGNASDSLETAVESGRGPEVVRLDNRTQALQAFDRAAIDGLLLGSINGSGVVSVTAIAPSSEFRTTLVVVELRDALARLERHLRDRYATRLTTRPVNMPPPGSGSTLYGIGYTVLLPLLVLLPAFIAGSIAVDTLAEEIERHTIELLRVTPLTPGEIVDGKAVAAIGSAPLQAVAWLALLTLNGTTITHPIALLVLVTAYAAVAVSLGSVLAVVTAGRRDAQLLYSFGTLLILVAATTAPESPVNTVAKLGIGSPTTVTWITVAATVLIAVLSYLIARTIVTLDLGSP